MENEEQPFNGDEGYQVEEIKYQPKEIEENIYKGRNKFIPTESDLEADKAKDRLIEAMKKEISILNSELIDIKRKYRALKNGEEEPKDLKLREPTDENESVHYTEIIEKQNKILENLQDELTKSKDDIKSLVKRNSKLIKYYEKHKNNENNSHISGPTKKKKLRMLMFS